MTTQTYIANGPWIDGKRVAPGAEVELTPAKAVYEPVTLKDTTKPARKPRVRADEVNDE